MDPDNEFMNLDFEKDSSHPKANLLKRPRLSSKLSAKGASKSLKPHNPEKAKT